jgi:hypothetical protein
VRVESPLAAGETENGGGGSAPSVMGRPRERETPTVYWAGLCISFAIDNQLTMRQINTLLVLENSFHESIGQK